MNILFFSSKVIKENGKGKLRVMWVWTSCLNEWEVPPYILGRKVYVCIETRPNCPFGRKSQNYFLCPLFVTESELNFGKAL